MSSTDLANDEIKQSIKQAEEESLAHSILKKTVLPRAKITHKGLEDIEDVNGMMRDRDRDKEQEDEYRMERERLARSLAAPMTAYTSCDTPLHLRGTTENVKDESPRRSVKTVQGPSRTSVRCTCVVARSGE